MNDAQRIEAPAKLLDKLRPVQEQIDRLSGELRAALFGAQVALDVPDGWRWDGAGWVEPEASGLAPKPPSGD